jgi:hypothetical protein
LKGSSSLSLSWGKVLQMRIFFSFFERELGKTFANVFLSQILNKKTFSNQISIGKPFPSFLWKKDFVMILIAMCLLSNLNLVHFLRNPW